MTTWREFQCDKPLYRISVSGPIKSVFREMKMYSAIHNTFATLAKDQSLADKQIVICSGGTDAGFMSLLYPTAVNHGFKTSSYLTCKIFNDEFKNKLVESDEIKLFLPLFNSPPTWKDASLDLISDADMHILFGMKEYEHANYHNELAVHKAEKDPDFQYRFVLVE
jgi:hypothetical protein